MAKEVRLPQLGQTMEEGTIVSCLVNVGDKVEKGDVIFEIETDKATLEMESPAAGFVKHIIAEVGQTIPVGDALIVLGDENEDVGQDFIDSLKTTAPDTPTPTEQVPAPAIESPIATPAPAPVAAPVPQAPASKTFASPRAKMAAQKLGVNLSAITGTGPNGRIVEADIQKAAQTSTAAKAMPTMPEPQYKLGETVPLTKTMKIIAQRMLQSKAEIPCFYLNVVVDATELVQARTKLNKTAPVKVSFNDFITKALATAMEQFPIMTGQLKGDNIQLAGSIGVGLAIAVEDGLVAPIIKEVEKKTLVEVAQYSKALIDRTRTGKLSPNDLAGGNITISNLGAFGIESFIPIVVPGQASILGVGKIIDTCVPSDGNLLVRKMMSLTLAVDHRIANGAYAAQFLDYIAKLLENPLF